ncbi:hypothetical protein B0H12DRAFT_1232749 [Mycena haematopus]|nr:hypothetical protein B0H12DRAFT_1232749 [Mycena haematopus]
MPRATAHEQATLPAPLPPDLKVVSGRRVTCALRPTSPRGLSVTEEWVRRLDSPPARTRRYEKQHLPTQSGRLRKSPLTPRQIERERERAVDCRPHHTGHERERRIVLLLRRCSVTMSLPLLHERGASASVNPPLTPRPTAPERDREPVDRRPSIQSRTTRNALHRSAEHLERHDPSSACSSPSPSSETCSLGILLVRQHIYRTASDETRTHSVLARLIATFSRLRSSKNPRPSLTQPTRPVPVNADSSARQARKRPPLARSRPRFREKTDSSSSGVRTELGHQKRVPSNSRATIPPLHARPCPHRPLR